LKKFSIQKITELPLIVTKLWPAHFCFKVMRWGALEAHLLRKYGRESGKKKYEEAREQAQISLRRVARFLSGAVHNPHRFWGSAITNRDIREALERWATWFGLDEEVFLATK
jgi:hypothetical protein